MTLLFPSVVFCEPSEDQGFWDNGTHGFYSYQHGGKIPGEADVLGLLLPQPL